MALSNHDRVGKSLELLNEGLKPFILREMTAAHGNRAADAARSSLQGDRRPTALTDEDSWDTQALLTIMWDQWNNVFRNTLGFAERSYVSELRDVRNKWAHQQSFTYDDAYRALDTIERLLTSISAEQVTEVNRHRRELQRLREEEERRQETRKASTAAMEGRPMEGLKPWREIIAPHPDVASGNYTQAEFAADLGQVYRGEGSDEYRKPRDFYARTYLTQGLKELLVGTLRRIAGTGGDPVVELQTNFGGGKTHSMLALYHLLSDVPASDLPGIEPVLKEAGVDRPLVTRRAVLVGTAPGATDPRTKPDGTTINTLWGEMAWQLLGQDGFALVAEADRRGVSPGSDALRELFKKASPCLILIDEWVAYLRNLYSVLGLPAGSFEANLTFAQALTESVKAVPGTLLVASLPESDMEVGGIAGREALERLQNTFGRIQSPWRPASTHEGFEIVRRRLFQPITDPASFAARDAVVRAFVEMYKAQSQEYPGGCGEGEYERLMQAAYPIHPELFERLYTDWSSLDKFQRTRGVLRLMAKVIQALWVRNDTGLMILPSSIALDDDGVQNELMLYLDQTWRPVIETDVDGPNSLPLRLDKSTEIFGRYSASRRVARTLFLGSAPKQQAAHKGLEDRRIKLGCTQPGEHVATFGDALRRLTDNATFLYVDGHRYWYSTQPSVTRLAQDRASQVSADAVAEEIRQRLRSQAKARSDFAGLHVCPASSADIPDDRDTRLVLLDPNQPHTAHMDDSPARQAADGILNRRGSGPRLYRNTLVFLAADKTRLDELDQSVRQFLAWKSIDDEWKTLNLDPFQASQARTKREQADQTVVQRIPETYSWLLVPYQQDPQGTCEWQETKLSGQDDLATRAAKKLRNEEQLFTQFAGTRLRYELDLIPLWRGDHVHVRQLADDFAQYLYLPRLKDTAVLLAAIEAGARSLTWEAETFAYADSYNAERSHYTGLKAVELAKVVLDAQSLLVKPEIALQQMRTETASTRTVEPAGVDGSQPSYEGNGTPSGRLAEPTEPVDQEVKAPRRFYGTITVRDPMRFSRDAGVIAQEVVQHLTSLLGAEVNITIEIQARMPEGAPDHTVRTVTENCRTLGFQDHGFETE